MAPNSNSQNSWWVISVNRLVSIFMFQILTTIILLLHNFNSIGSAIYFRLFIVIWSSKIMRHAILVEAWICSNTNMWIFTGCKFSVLIRWIHLIILLSIILHLIARSYHWMNLLHILHSFLILGWLTQINILQLPQMILNQSSIFLFEFGLHS